MASDTKNGPFSGGMLARSLEYLYQTLKQTEAGAFYSTDKLSFILDSNFNDTRGFLLSLIQDKTCPLGSRELAAKILIQIGIKRSNIEDYMQVLSLLDSKEHSDLDIRSELELI